MTEKQAARRRLAGLRERFADLPAELEGVRATLARAREQAYQARRAAVRAAVAEAREQFYGAVRRLAREEHAALVRACADGNRQLGRTEFVGLACHDLDAVEALRALRGADDL